MKKEYLINTTEINKAIKSKHSDFLKTFGSYIDKVVADGELKEAIMLSRLRFIIECFKSEKIIDVIQECNIEHMTKGFIIGIKQADRRLFIATNGIMIAIKEPTREETYKKFYNVYREDFDWTDFSIQLLDIIHLIIYERKLAAESKLNSVFAGV